MIATSAPRDGMNGSFSGYFSDGPEGTVIRLEGDGGSLRVVEGTGGMKALSDDDKAEIVDTIDEKILKRRPIVFRSTAVRTASRATATAVAQAHGAVSVASRRNVASSA